MANKDPNLNLGDVLIDPEVQNRYERAMLGNATMPAPPPVDHPIVQMAQKMLAPLSGPVGPMGPQGGSLYPSEQLNRTPTQQDNLLAQNRQRAQTARDVFLQQAQSGSVGPMGPMPAFPTPADAAPKKFAPRSLAGMDVSKFDYGQPIDVGQVARNLTVDNPMFTAPRRPRPNETPPLGQGVADFVSNIPVVSGLANFATKQIQQGPLSTDILGSNPDYNDIQAMPNGPEKQRALDELRQGQLLNAAMGSTGGIGKAGRFIAEAGKTRSLIRDTVTGKTEPTIFTSADHAAEAEAAAAKLNATSGTAPEAGIAVAPDAQLTGALTQIPTNLETEVRRTARTTPELTGETLASLPETRTFLDRALAAAKIEPTDANAAALGNRLLAQEKARPTVGNRNYAALRDALGAPKEQPLIDFGPEPVRPTLTGPKLVATSPDATPLPFGPTRVSAGRAAADIAGEILGLPRALKAGLDLSAVALQGAQLLLGDIVGTPKTLLSMARGGTQRPYAIPALGQMLRATVSGPGRVSEITQGFRDSLTSAGLPVRGGFRQGGIFLADAAGPIAAREEHMLGNLATKIPLIGLFYRQGNHAYATLLNALRTGEALNLKAAYDSAGIPVKGEKIAHFVNIATGRGDLPFANSEIAQRAADAMSGIFFGPRLLTSGWQSGVDTILSLKNAGSDLLSRKPLDPTDLARVRTTATFVLTGYGAMKLMEASGMPIGVDFTKSDFGRGTLPDGRRFDVWGPFNENARLVLRELDAFYGGLTGRKPVYGQNPLIDPLTSYFRNKLNVPAAAVYDFGVGKTPIGVPANTAYNPFDPNNPVGRDILQNPAAPVPFGAEQAIQSFDLPYPGKTASTGGQGGLLGAGEVAASVLGLGVYGSKTPIVRDGLGRTQTDPNYNNDPVLHEFQTLFPDKTLGPADGTIGSGKNSVRLPATEVDAYVAAVSEERRVALSSLIYSQEYQNATQAQREKMFTNAKEKADNTATREYLAHGVIDSTDPKVIQAEAVAGFHAQGGGNKNEAYWIALLDRAGKLTPEVAKAIDDSNVVVPGQRAPITVEEYRNDAPLVHEYLGHVPYGTDAHPLGTPADWTAVEAAKKQQGDLKDAKIRSGIHPNLAEIQAKQETLANLRSLVQRNLFLNGASLTNPQRRLLATKYGTRLTRYLGGNDVPYTQESEAQYTNFPFGR